jgi:NADP-dependent 3-hydroxy acid dehydrogenase YdfG
MRKIVVITGAGAGVGRATATEFARNGCDVALLSRDNDRLERIQKRKSAGVLGSPSCARSSQK